MLKHKLPYKMYYDIIEGGEINLPFTFLYGFNHLKINANVE